MSTHPYYTNTDTLLKSGFKREEIFDYLSDKDSELFNLYFDFCHTNLTKKWNHYPIRPVIVFFYNSEEVNAFAKAEEKYFLIAINRGLIIQLYDFFYKGQHAIDDTVAALFPVLPGKLDVPLYFYFYQLTTLFTYYHEHGHVLQFISSPLSLIGEKRQLTSDDDYNKVLHAMEIDADIHGAHLITFHVIQYWKKLPKEDQTKENLENLLAITASGIFIFFFFINNGISPLYFFEATHPHEVIRISYIIDTIVGVVRLELPELATLDTGRTLQNAFKISDNLLKAQLNSSINEYAETFIGERHSIGEYLQDMSQYMDDLLFLVRNHDNPYR